MKNYRYKFVCKECGKFIKKNDEHKNCPVRQKGYKYRCGTCNLYKTKLHFPKDKTHRFGIRFECKKCRSLRGNGNKMMSEKEIKEKINELKRQIRLYEEIVNKKSQSGFGRPKGSIKYSDEQVRFLIDNKDKDMIDIITGYNEIFGTNIGGNSRQLYNFMIREGIIEQNYRRYKNEN